MDRTGQDQVSSEEPNYRSGRPVCKTTFRAASPCLRQFPLETVDYALPETIHAKAPLINERTREILDQYGLLDDETEVRIAYRRREDSFSDRGFRTLLVVTKWSTDDAGQKWTKAVEDMVALVDETFQTPAHAQIVLEVEMIAPQRLLPGYLDAVPNRPDLRAAWPRISSIVRDRLAAHEATFNRNPITVYISVFYESDETQWDGVVDDIRSNLRNDGWAELSIHIQPNEIFTGLWYF
ncbi:hypothetical protein EDB81DRAFT_928158 [Dactylonectria macrodidyma]|uniref:Uncharacterized protein n=1 Tax=Dactylonectria macrodidyma TaxID=307937 RepID=A0A9P9FA20_9HYPO|nr:hypothetical protein EDB81DRAFT_928158 [Dactylonectria macrodidyma]